MRTLVWSSQYEIGIAVIDSDHKQLFELVGAIQRLIDDGNLPLARDMIQEFIEVAKNHFAREMELLLRIGFPDRDNHGRYHAALLTKAREIKAQSDNEFGRAEAARLYSELLALLLDDVIRGDMHFKDFIEARAGIAPGGNSGAAPVR